MAGLVVGVVLLVGWIYWDAFACWRAGGKPVASIGHFACVGGAR